MSKLLIITKAVSVISAILSLFYNITTFIISMIIKTHDHSTCLTDESIFTWSIIQPIPSTFLYIIHYLAIEYLNHILDHFDATEQLYREQNGFPISSRVLPSPCGGNGDVMWVGPLSNEVTDTGITIVQGPPNSGITQTISARSIFTRGPTLQRKIDPLHYIHTRYSQVPKYHMLFSTYREVLSTFAVVILDFALALFHIGWLIYGTVLYSKYTTKLDCVPEMISVGPYFFSQVILNYLLPLIVVTSLGIWTSF